MRGRWAFALAAIGGLLQLSSCNADAGGPPASYDPTELALVRLEPADGESAVPRNRVVRMFFNTQVLPESVDDQSILVRVGGTFQSRPEGAFLTTGDTVEFDPTIAANGGRNAIGFPAGEQVLVEIRLYEPDVPFPEPAEQFLQNIEGNPIGIASGDNIINFVTGSGWIDPVPGPPGVLGLEFTPGPNNVGQVSPFASVTVVFSEPIDPGTFLLGKNIFLTNNTPTAPPSIYQQDIPAQTFFDGSLTRYTMQPVFGFGQGPFKILVNFIDPDAPSTFDPTKLPADLGGNAVLNFTFFGEFDTQFDPTAQTYGLLKEEFTSTTKRDSGPPGGPNPTDAVWGSDPEFPFALVGQIITTRNQNVNIAAISNITGGTTPIDNPPCSPSSQCLGVNLNLTPGEEDYCPNQYPLVGSDSLIPPGNPPASAGRRQLNLYRQPELGARGTVIRVAWGPDSDATFAATYPAVILRLGHKQRGTDLANAGMTDQFDVDGFVTLVNQKDYTVPQAFDINGGQTNDGYLDWPALDIFFDYDGMNDLLLDVEAGMGGTYQTFRDFLALDVAFGICTCFNFAGCALTNNSIGQRQMDSTYGGDFADPSPIPATVANPSPFVHIMQFEIAKLRSDAQSLAYDTGVDDPDYLSHIVNPLVQQGGATIALTWSGSHDGMNWTAFTPNIHAVDGHRYIRWNCILRANLFTGGRPRIETLEMPFLVQ
jgi:hypothetical protein